jgi:hypothetical protein
MFTSEQPHRKKSLSSLKNGISRTGMPLAKGSYVFKSVNYKELTLAAGILVAVMILIFLWLDQHDVNTTSHLHQLTLPKVSFPETRKLIQETIQKVLL